jgi:molybdenum cofactor biosynthesis protein MoaC
MIDVGDKTPTRRRAEAVGTLRMGRAAFRLLRDGKLPKGDALAIGQTAGIMAAKRTGETIALCHPLPLDSVSVAFECDESLPGVRARCVAAAFAKTGVEMEALAGATGALLAVYDLVKQVDPALEIGEVRLEYKEGGKTGFWHHPKSSAPGAPRPAQAPKLGRACVITVSDRASRGRRKDLSGPALAAGLRELGFKVDRKLLLPDDGRRIESAIRSSAKGRALVALAGGTGLSPRDLTPEAVAAACDRLIPGIGEALRAFGARHLAHACLSRSTAGLAGNCLVVCLPGSPGGVRDGLAVLSELLPHAIHVARGGDHRR